jgi:hypothetical protein
MVMRSARADVLVHCTYGTLSFDLPPDADAELPERLRRLLEDFTPRVQLLEDGALLDLTGATPMVAASLGMHRLCCDVARRPSLRGVGEVLRGCGFAADRWRSRSWSRGMSACYPSGDAVRNAVLDRSRR